MPLLDERGLWWGDAMNDVCAVLNWEMLHGVIARYLGEYTGPAGEYMSVASIPPLVSDDDELSW